LEPDSSLVNDSIHRRARRARRVLCRFAGAAGAVVAVGTAAAQGVGPDRTPAPFFEAVAVQGAAPGSRFLSPSTDTPFPFVERPGNNPARICDALDEAGFVNLGWKSSAMGAAGECLSAASQVEDGQDEPNSLFYMLRTRGGPRLGYARLKINLPRPAEAQVTLELAADFLRAFSAETRTAPPQAVYAGIEAAEPFRIATREVSYTMKKEFGEPPRYNLSIDFGPTPNALHWTAELGPYRTVRAAPSAAAPGAGVVTTAKTSRLARPAAAPD
jgi:hypothetical protein